jgi:alanine racemase
MIPAALTTTFSPDTMRAWVDVDLSALVSNARKVAAVSRSRLLPMIKANGYGLGAVEVARALAVADPWGFGVASIDEAEILRSAGVDRPILVATPLIPQWVQRYLELDLRPSIGDPFALDAWLARGDRPFHLEIDTGMSRSGVRWNDSSALERIRSILKSASGWEGVYTHFLDAETDPQVTALQWSRFQGTLQALPRRPALVHAANSAAALQGTTYAADLVRPGIFLYGGVAGSAVPKPVAALRGRVVSTRALAPGDTVGYGATWRAERPSAIATIALGYADGFPRSARGSLPGGREVEVNGKVVPVVARVTMDMCMILVEQPVKIGDVGTIYGGMISLERQAEAAGIISYELLTRIGSRVPRRYR